MSAAAMASALCTAPTFSRDSSSYLQPSSHPAPAPATMLLSTVAGRATHMARIPVDYRCLLYSVGPLLVPLCNGLHHAAAAAHPMLFTNPSLSARAAAWATGWLRCRCALWPQLPKLAPVILCQPTLQRAAPEQQPSSHSAPTLTRSSSDKSPSDAEG